ncbi:beta-xylosidase [Bifidobacterium lemurum]|uniref:Beta-xylosidase n=1 Tax=Bifidobacterium lemurum TaxID=1603886 RepID=A0A261FV42_9BIFI|nr:glycoside hydrolase family 43 protein [Bifidobacterium lemurum]OZG63051.1 beta-xylosidase [Bifidobacterium lemurum]QOL33385.1 glycoside hydrolase family 43 protein [Bifidobacterium lemurum]
MTIATIAPSMRLTSLDKDIHVEAPITPKPLMGRSYANPVPYSDGGKHTAPDPFVLRYRNRYYCYATDEHGILVSTSPDLVRWTSHGYAYVEQGRRNFWAPSVILLNGVFHMYFSNMPEGESDTHTEIMRVATSVDPLGPFEKQAELFDTFAIDSQVVMGDDGQLYLLYADNQEVGLSDVRPGTSVMIDRLSTPLKREGNPRALIVPTMDEEIFARNRFGDGRDWHTIEGATYFTYRDRAFITYSANAYEHEDYFVGYSTAVLPSVPAEVHIDGLVWNKQLNNGGFDPLLIRSDRVEGTGHNSIVRAPNAIDDWIVYHGRNADDELYVGTEQRVMRIDPLYFSEGLLDTDGPTCVEVDAPLLADVSADFSNGIPASWTTLSGNARAAEVEGEPALVADQRGIFETIAPLDSSTVGIDVWIRGICDPLGARCGVIVRHRDADNRTIIELDGGTHELHVIDIVNGLSMRAVTALPLDIDLTAWHELSVSRAYRSLEIRIDGRYVAEAMISDEPGAVGLYSNRTGASFSAFVATDHVNLWGETLAQIHHEVTAIDPLRVNHGVTMRGVRPATLVVEKSLEKRRFVLDFALETARSQVLVTFGDYRITLAENECGVMCDGVALEGASQPVRLRSLSSDVRRDQAGRALRTVRISSANGKATIHIRNHTWQVPLAGEPCSRLGVTLNGASLVGYTRTSLGLDGKEGAE